MRALKIGISSILSIGLLVGATTGVGSQIDGEPSIPSSGCAQPLAEPGVYDAINDFEDAAQAYRVVVPEGYAESAPAPLILFLAAHFGQLELSAEMWRPYLAPARSIFVTAEQTTFDHARPSTLTALIDQLATDYCIDGRRVHAMGMSSSATAVAALACDAPDRIGSFSVVVGNFHDTCAVPLIAVTGDHDRTRVGDSVERWAEANGCDPEPVAEDLGSGVTRKAYQSCDADTVLYDVEGAGHGFIRQECVDPALYCFENEVFDVLREVEAFLAVHPLRATGVVARTEVVWPPSAGCDQPLAEPGVYEATNDFEGVGQAYRVVVPEGYAEANPSPLILWLATHQGTLDEQWIFWSPFLDQVEAVFVVSQGRSSSHRKVPTLSALIDEVSAQYCIDMRRIHAMSISSGAPVTASLACAAPERIASVMIGMGDFTRFQGCTPEAPVPLVAFTGEDDKDRDGVSSSVEAWAEAYGCAPEPTAEDLGSGVIRHTYEGCAADLVLYDIEGVGHGFVRHECFDTVLCFDNEVFDQVDVAQAFFAEHPLPAE